MDLAVPTEAGSGRRGSVAFGLAGVVRDVRYAARLLMKSPAFSVAAVLSLAVGVGGITAVFAIWKAVFLRPLPFHDPSGLAALYTTDETNPGLHALSFLNFKDMRRRNSVFTDMAISSALPVNISSTPEPRTVIGEIASASYFSLLGAPAALGRVFGPGDELSPVVVLNHNLWTSLFRADRGIIGRPLTLNGHVYQVIGVAAPWFRGIDLIEPPQLWVPMGMYHDMNPTPGYAGARRVLDFYGFGRLKDGVTLDEARTNLSQIAHQLANDHPKENTGRGVHLLPLAEATIDPNTRQNLVRAAWVVFSLTLALLLIAGANVANLLLVRFANRRKEMAVMISMGALPGRLARLVLTETLLLTLAGGAAGIAVARAAVRLLWSLRPASFTMSLDTPIDAAAILFAAGVSILAGIAAALAPARQAFRPDLSEELKERSRQPVDPPRFSLRDALAAAQVALSLMALVGAGLFLRSLRNSEQADPGFETKRLALARLNVGAQGYRPRGALQFYRDVVRRVAALEGVQSAALASNHPLSQEGFMRSVYLEGHSSTREGGVFVMTNAVSPGYFETTDILILRGHDFSERECGPREAIVNQTMAQRFWPDADPIGKRFYFFGDKTIREVIGVARDSSYFSIGEKAKPYIYVPLSQNYMPAVTLFARTDSDPAAMLEKIRKQIQPLDPGLPLERASTMADRIRDSLWAPRLCALMLSAVGLFGLVLAAVGFYGFAAWEVRQHSQEIGLRMAVGASRHDMTQLVLGRGLLLTIPGLALGGLASLALARLVDELLVGVCFTDPQTYAVMALLLVVVTMMACYLPARRFTRTWPIEQLNGSAAQRLLL